MEQICLVCLAQNRDLTVVSDDFTISFFSDILDDEPLDKVTLCWECNHFMNKITQFRYKAEKSSKILKGFLKNNYRTLIIRPFSSLSKNNLYNINVRETSITEGSFEIVQPESTNPINDTPSDTKWDNLLTNDLEMEICEQNKFIDVNKYLEDKVGELKEGGVKRSNRERKRPKKLSESSMTDLDSKIAVLDSHPVLENGEKICYKIIVLTEQEVMEDLMQQANSRAYVFATYKCVDCIKIFPNKETLKHHFLTRHSATRFKCKICRCTFSNKIHHKMHMSKHTHVYECIECNHRFPTKSRVLRHYDIYHNVGLYKCDLCQDTFASNSDFTNHMNDHALKSKKDAEMISGMKPPYPCNYCHKVFERKRNYLKHMEIHTSNGVAQIGQQFGEEEQNKIMQKLVQTPSVPVTNISEHKTLIPKDIQANFDALVQCDHCNSCFTKLEYRKHLHRIVSGDNIMSFKYTMDVHKFMSNKRRRTGKTKEQKKQIHVQMDFEINDWMAHEIK